MWLPALLLGALVVATGLVPVPDALAVTERVAPVLLFLVAVTVLAELSEAAQVFDVAAGWLARRARGRTLALFGLVALLAAATTAVLSLDTTAVLVTPVVLALAARLALPAEPFALLVVWLSCTGSLLLPVSNLTNLLAVDRLDLTVPEYVRAVLPASLVGVLVPVVLLLLWQRRLLVGRYLLPVPVRPQDPVLSGVAAAACLLLVPALLLGVPVAVAASASAAVVVLGCLVRARGLLRWSLVPWRLVLLVEGLFVVVEAAGPHGLDALLQHATGSPLQVAAVAAGLANAVDNLPAYLALERVVPHDRLLALLAGVDLGPLVLPWGSLATLLWAERCRARGVQVPWLRFAAAGLVLVPLVLLATVPLLPS